MVAFVVIVVNGDMLVMIASLFANIIFAACVKNKIFVIIFIPLIMVECQNVSSSLNMENVQMLNVHIDMSILNVNVMNVHIMHVAFVDTDPNVDIDM